MGERRSIAIKKGLDLPIAGQCEQVIEEGVPISQVAVVGPDYLGLRPTMAVAEGDVVQLGQLLFQDKRTPGVRFTAPAAGRVAAVNRGAKRALQSVVIDVGGSAAGDDEVRFDHFASGDVAGLTSDQVRSGLIESGLWVALRTRPFSKVPLPDVDPRAIFITAIDTNPLAAEPGVALTGREGDFRAGVQALTKLTSGEVYLCTAPGAQVPTPDLADVTVVEFAGPHPAGLVGTHIHFLDAVDLHRTVLHVNYQDVAAIGHLFTSGRLDVSRVVSLGGPAVARPRLVRTRLGAAVGELVAGELREGENRVVSGSVLCGRAAVGDLGYLGRYHLQISALREGRERELLGWQMPGWGKFSIKRVFAARLARKQIFDFTTSTEGSPRAMVPVGSYEGVMPLDIMPTFLLRALASGDYEAAQELGCLELDEEDLGLCTFVSPGKTEYGTLLRQNLEIIEKEG